MKAITKSLMVGAVCSLATVAVSVSANALPCGTTTLNNWLVSGFSCQVGDLTFSGFNYVQDGFNGTLGRSNTPATSVGVAPAFTTAGPGVGFNGFWDNAGTTSADALITFNVTAPATHPITDFHLLLGGVQGSVLDVASLSNGVTLSSSNNVEHAVTFAPVTSLLVVDDIGVNAGGSISVVEKQFTQTTQTPEPASLALLGSALLGFGVMRRRRKTS